MMSAALFAESESEPARCLCGHPESAHSGGCRAGHVNERHLLAEAKKAAKRRGLDPIMLSLAVLIAKGRACECRQFRADLWAFR